MDIADHYGERARFYFFSLKPLVKSDHRLDPIAKGIVGMIDIFEQPIEVNVLG